MSLAMTLITDPSVLVLDDSTSALDAKTEARVQMTLRRILKGRTAFVITAIPTASVMWFSRVPRAPRAASSLSLVTAP